MQYHQTLPVDSELIGEFKILGLLGSGGFANTYLALDMTLGRNVAIKEYFPADLAIRAGSVRVQIKTPMQEQQFRWGLDRFVREAKTLAKFRHPSVVRVFRVFDANETAYIVLEFVNGSNMETWLKALGRPPSQDEFDELMLPLLDALEVVHDAGILHRDIKPPNIYIREADQKPVLLDFGAARFAVGEYTGTTAAIVSKGYSPHEAYATDARLQGPWTDIYGLAATIYRALSGSAPPESTSRVLEDECMLAADLPFEPGTYRQDFLDAIDAGMAIMPRARPQSIAEWRRQLFPHLPEIASGELANASEPRTAGSQPKTGPRRGSQSPSGQPSKSSSPPSFEQGKPSRPSGAAPSRAPSASPAARADEPLSRPTITRAMGGERNVSLAAGVALFLGGAAMLIGTQSGWFDRSPSSSERLEQKAPEDRVKIEQTQRQAEADRTVAAAAAAQQKEAEERRLAEAARAKEAEAAALEKQRAEEAQRQAEADRVAAAAAAAQQKEAEERRLAEAARAKEAEAAALEKQRAEQAEADRLKREEEIVAKQRRDEELRRTEARLRQQQEEAAAAKKKENDERRAVEDRLRKEQETALKRKEEEDRRRAEEDRSRREQEAAAAKKKEDEERRAAQERLRKEQEAALKKKEEDDRRRAEEERLRREQEVAAAEKQKQEESQRQAELAKAEEEQRIEAGRVAAVDSQNRIRTVLQREEYLKQVQGVLKDTDCYSGNLDGDIADTKVALDRVEKNYEGQWRAIDLASATPDDFDGWLTWFKAIDKFSCPAEEPSRGRQPAQKPKPRKPEPDRPRKVQKRPQQQKPVISQPRPVQSKPSPAPSSGGGGYNSILKGTR